MDGNLQDIIKEIENSLAQIREAILDHPDDPDLLEVERELLTSLGSSRGLDQTGSFKSKSGEGWTDVDNAERLPAAEQIGRGTDPSAAGAPTRQREFLLMPSIPGRTNFSRGNARIHPRNRYALNQPCFSSLALDYPRLEKYLVKSEDKANGRVQATLDWQLPGATATLTWALLHRDFGVEWSIPDGSLVPPLTNRLNYISWISELVDDANAAQAGADTHSGHADASKRPLTSSIVRGLDIGCGSNLIYCILGAQDKGWHMTGVDIDPNALVAASAILRANPPLRERIELRRSPPQPGQLKFLAGQVAPGTDDSPIVSNRPVQANGLNAGLRPSGERSEHSTPPAEFDAPTDSEEPYREARLDDSIGLSDEPVAFDDNHVSLGLGDTVGSGIISSAVKRGEGFDFTMCNPPFFERIEDAGSNPDTAFGGRPIEMTYPGGEAAFVQALAADSLLLRERIPWFSTMVGKKKTISQMRAWLAAHGVQKLRTTTLSQGKTSRWAIAWSWVRDSSSKKRKGL